MRNPYKIILLISACLVGLVFLHEYIYDTPGAPLKNATTWDYVNIVFGEIFAAGIYFGIFFAVLSIVYFVASQIIKLIAPIFRSGIKENI